MDFLIRPLCKAGLPMGSTPSGRVIEMHFASQKEAAKKFASLFTGMGGRKYSIQRLCNDYPSYLPLVRRRLEYKPLCNWLPFPSPTLLAPPLTLSLLSWNKDGLYVMVRDPFFLKDTLCMHLISYRCLQIYLQGNEYPPL